MQRIEVQQFVKNILAPVDNTGRFHMENIKIACDIVYSQWLSRIDDALVGDLDLFAKEYTSQTVTLDATRNLYYSTLPTPIVPIPGITSGIRRINTDEGLDLDFAPITEQEINLMDGSVTHTTDTTIYYWLQGSTIWYNESMTSDIATAGVRIAVLPRFSGFATTDSINIPGAADMDFISAVIQLLAPTAPVNLKANNAN